MVSGQISFFKSYDNLTDAEIEDILFHISAENSSHQISVLFLDNAVSKDFIFYEKLSKL